MSKLNDLSKEEWAEHNNTVWECSSYNGYLASFDVEIPKRLIQYFTKKGDFVLDPFVGSGTTLLAAQKTKRNSLGTDCNKEAIENARKKINNSIKNKKVITKAVEADSRDLSFIESRKFDLVITSPPYFDIIDYSDDEEQIGNISRYEKFIDNVLEVLKESKRLLKGGKYLCIVTGDIRKNNRYFPIHNDYINRLRKLDFKLHQIMINVFKTSGRGKREECMGYPSNFHPWMIHEYILIFQKEK